MAERAAPAVVVVGSYNRDVTFIVPRFPAPGETLIGATRIETPGGKGANQAIQAARCGSSVAMIAAVGQDAAGDEALNLWRGEGIGTAGVVRLADVGTGMAAILVDAGGENMIVVDSAANAALTPVHIDAAAELIRGAKVVVCQLEVPHDSVRRTLEFGRAGGATNLLNAAPAPAALDPDLLELVDVLVVNAGEGAALTGKAEPKAIAAALLERTPVVVVTLGAEGVLALARGGERHRLHALPVDVVDTTGAGDAFVGALAHGLACGDPLSSAIAFGIAAGALACTKRGAAGSLASREEINRRLFADAGG